MKKTLALVLAFALVFSTMTMAFADDAAAISADAKICADLGMLVGDGSGVTPAYTATSPNRLQAAVMFLRLKGLEAEANAFTGTDTFADAKKVAWGQPVMAYLKAHPELGWIGDGKNFDPASAMTAQQYYKVMLEALGYKQNTATVVGDFTWENVMTFAASKGLTKNAAVTSFTVNDLAVATVEALKATVKDGNKTLVATLVEAGKIDKAKAIASGVMGDTTSTDAKLSGAVASANDGVEVTFDADVAKDFAENVANYKIVVKGSTTALEVKAAKAVSSTVVALTTAVQTGGTAYSLTVGTVTANFAGLAKNTAVPEIDTVKCVDTNTIEIVFKKAMDRASVEDVANYTLNNGATVTKAELWVDQDDSRMTVKLTTDGVANNKVYKLKVANVKSADLVAIKTVEKSFSGVADTTAPKISGNVIVKNNQRIWVKFDDKHGVDKATAENIANWSIDGLTINKITAKDDDGANFGVDDYGYLDLVEIDTEPMTANHKYTITINNLVDGSTSKNAIAKALTKTFYGVAVDKTAPKVGSIKVYGDNLVEVPFTDANRIDYTAATDVNNYTFTDGLQVLSAQVIRSSKPDSDLGKTVVLTTSTMDTDTTYKISIANVSDEFGNVMTSINNRNIERSKGQDIAPPAVTNTVWKDKNTLEVYFNERLDLDSANDPTNYVLNNDLGAVRKAEISGSKGYQMVTLTTPDMTTNKNYKLTITGVKDRVGNEMANYKAYFTAGQTSVDTDAPEIDNIVAVNKNEVQVTFDEAVKTIDTSALTLRAITGVDSNGNTTYGPAITGTVQGIGRAGFTIDDNMTIVYKLSANLSDAIEYSVHGLSLVTDTHNNLFKVPTNVNDEDTFYGSSDDPEDLEVVAVDQLNVKKLQVTFSRPILIGNVATSSKDATTLEYNNHTGTVGGYSATIDTDDDETTDALSVLTLENSSTFKVNNELNLVLSNVTDYAGRQVVSTDRTYKYTTYLEDTDDPVIDYVESVSTKKIQVHYNEELDKTRSGAAGGYSIEGPFTKNSSTITKKSVPVAATAIDGDDYTIVNLNVSTLSLIPGEVYTLYPTNSAKDWAGNSSATKDVSFEFVASAVVVNDYIKGVAVIDAKNIEVRSTASLSNIVVTETATGVIVGTTASTGTAVAVAMYTPLLEDVKYTVSGKIGTDDASYNFYGIMKDGQLQVQEAYDTTGTVLQHIYITFSDFNAADYIVNVVYASNTSTVLTYNITSQYTVDGFDAFADTGFKTIPAGAQYTVEVIRKDDMQTIYAYTFTR